MKPTREEVIRVARECGALANAAGTIQLLYPELERLVCHFYEAGAAAAREPLVEKQTGAMSLVVELLSGDVLQAAGPAALELHRLHFANEKLIDLAWKLSDALEDVRFARTRGEEDWKALNAADDDLRRELQQATGEKE